MRSARLTARRSPLPRRILRPRSMSRTLASWLRTPRPGPDHPARAPSPACSTRGRDGRRRRAGRRGREPRTGRHSRRRPVPRRAGPRALLSRRFSSSVPRQDRCARRRAKDARAGPSGTRPRLPPFVRAGAAALRSTAVTSGSLGSWATIRSKRASASTVRPDRASCSARLRSVDGDWHAMDRTSAVARGRSIPVGLWCTRPNASYKKRSRRNVGTFSSCNLWCGRAFEIRDASGRAPCDRRGYGIP